MTGSRVALAPGMTPARSGKPHPLPHSPVLAGGSDFVLSYDPCRAVVPPRLLLRFANIADPGLSPRREVQRKNEGPSTRRDSAGSVAPFLVIQLLVRAAHFDPAVE